jgi:hypothetical protein
VCTGLASNDGERESLPPPSVDASPEQKSQKMRKEKESFGNSGVFLNREAAL